MNQRVHDQDLKLRIIEIYRQCYEQSPVDPEGVIADFVRSTRNSVLRLNG